MYDQLGVAITVTVCDCHFKRCHSNRTPLYFNAVLYRKVNCRGGLVVCGGEREGDRKGGCFVSSSFARPSERRGRGSFQIGIDEWCMAAGLIYVI